MPLRLWVELNEPYIKDTPHPRVTFSPEYEKREVANYNGMSWTMFRTLPYTEQVKTIAFCRLQNVLEWVRAVYKDTRKA